MLPADVVSIALETRKHFEDVAKREHLRPTLKHLCKRASTYLALKLKSAGYNATVRQGNIKDISGWPTGICHSWVEFNNTHIIDLTATQFGYTDKVLISPIKSTKYDSIC